MAKLRIILVTVLCVSALLACTVAEPAKSTTCDIEDTDGQVTPIERNCSISNLQITPCPEAKDDLPCKIKRGESVTLSFDFIPKHASDELTGRAYWANELVDLPLLGMDTNACNYTSCPLTPNTKHSYSYNLQIKKFFPVRTYNVKWRLWNPDEDLDCCFITTIKLVK